MTVAEAKATAATGDLVNRLAQELAQLQRSLADAHRKLASTNRSLEVRTQELAEARTALTLLRASLDCAQDGLVAAARFGRTLHGNARFSQIWGISQHQLDGLNDAALLALQLTLVADPQRYRADAEMRRDRPDDEHRGHITLRDGRTLAFHVIPHRAHGRRVGTVTAWREVEGDRLS